MKRKNGKIAIELEPNKSVLRPAHPTARSNVRCYCIIFMFHGTVVGVEISACCQNGSGTVDYRLTSSQDRPFGRISLSGKPRLPSPTDFNSLVAALVEHRDRAAFAQLFDYFVPRLQSHLIRLGTDSAQAEEITQDVMVTLWHKAHLFDSRKSALGTWLFRIARNRRIDRLRRTRIDVVDPADGFDDIVADTPDADAMIDLGKQEDMIRLALADLPEEQLMLVRLAFFDGLSHSEIAEKTGLPLGTVKSRIRLAFTRLRRGMEERTG